MDFYPISLFFAEIVTLVDSLGEVAIETTNTDALTLADTLSPPEIEATFTQVMRIRDYVVAVLDGTLVEAWRKTVTSSTDDSLWRRTDRNV
jgi:hypothetical protein